MKKKYLSGLLAMALWIALVPVAFATPITFQATVPTFDVTLNGVTVDNSYRQYPLLVYKDITYFPITYDDCRFLGLSTDWSSATGLSIEKTAVSSYAFEQTLNLAKNNNSYQVGIAQFPIKLNGTSIDNKQESYPLLLFRGITYFPLTWQFVVDQFGWSYDFNLQKGLMITSYALPPSDGNHHQPIKVTHQFNDVSVHILYNWFKPAANNLTIERNDTVAALGDPQYAYGYTLVSSKDEHGFNRQWQMDSEMSLLDDWLYTTAAIPGKSTTSTPCKINIITNETILTE